MGLILSLALALSGYIVMVQMNPRLWARWTYDGVVCIQVDVISQNLLLCHGEHTAMGIVS